MKTRDIKELQTKTQAELLTMIKELRESLVTASLDHAQRKLTNTSSITTMRHDIARLSTVLQLKKMEPASAPAPEVKTVKGGKTK